MTPEDYDELVREHHMENYARAFAEQFVEYVISEATDHGEYDGDRPGDAIIELVNGMHRAGFTPSEIGDDEVRVEAFAGPDAYEAMRDGYELESNVDLTNVNQIGIGGINVQIDPSLPNNLLLAVHLDGIAPALPSSRKSWLVKHPKAVRTIRITDGEGAEQ